MPTATCENCGALVQRDPSKMRRNRRHFCSRACRAAHERQQPSRETIAEVPCAACGATLRRRPATLRAHPRSYCNFACRSVWRSANLSGERSWAWRGGWRDYYGPNWKTARSAARKRDGYRCQGCGVDESALSRQLEVHHVRPFRTFGYIPGGNDCYKAANALENLVTLCPACHKRAEPREVSFQLPLFVPRAADLRRSAIRSRTAKKCGRCHIVKPLDAFHRHRSNPDGRHGFCKACRRVVEPTYAKTA